MRLTRLFFVSAILFPGIIFSQSAWTQPDGGGYFKLTQSMIRAGQFFNPDGETIDITTTSVYSTTLYGEYGVSDKWTLLLNAPLFVRSTINERESSVDGFVIPGDEFNGIGDIYLGAKYGIKQTGGLILAASAQIKLPSGDNVGGDTELLQTGDGAWGGLFLIHASYSFYPAPVYVSVAAGFNWRGEADLDFSTGPVTVNYDDGFRWMGEIGWTPGDHWALALKWDHLIALENGTDTGLNGGSSIFGNRISYFAVTPEVNYIFKNGIGISAAVGGVLSAENILAAPNVSLGVFYNLGR